MSDEAAAAPPASPFRLLCPQCGADADDPNLVFGLHASVPLPDSHFLLLDVTCHPCGSQSDMALWVAAPPEEAIGHPLLQGEPESPEQHALLRRFAALADDFRRQTDHAIAEWLAHDAVLDFPEIDLPDVDLGPVLDVAETRWVAVPARVVAAARGVRASVEAHHDPAAPPVKLRLHDLLALLGLEENASGEDRLHLSVSHQVLGPLLCSPVECMFLVCLFTAPSELPTLSHGRGESGQVRHYWWWPA